MFFFCFVFLFFHPEEWYTCPTSLLCGCAHIMEAGSECKNGIQQEFARKSHHNTKTKEPAREGASHVIVTTLAKL